MVNYQAIPSLAIIQFSLNSAQPQNKDDVTCEIYLYYYTVHFLFLLVSVILFSVRCNSFTLTLSCW